jgi:Peptidase family M28
MRILHFFFFLIFAGSAIAQPTDTEARKGDPAVMIASTIKGEQISEYVHVLAADDMEGRETGKPGNRRAAEYIASKFDEMGIPSAPGYDSHFQELAFTRVKLGATELTVNEFTYRNMKDFVVIPSNMPTDQIVFDTDEIVFMGYGIEDSTYSDYTYAKDLSGKTILIYSGEPFDSDKNSLVTGTVQWSRWSTSLEDKLRVAKSKGVAGVVVIAKDFQQLASQQRRFILSGRTIMGTPEFAEDQAPHIIASSTLTESLLGKKKKKVIKTRDKIAKKGKLKPVVFPASVKGTFTREVNSTPGVNILAYIEGIDPDMKDEIIVITAHYDHIGTRGDDIYNGADDNASGTSGVMEIAQAFQEAKNRDFGPRRSVLCMLVTGEEKGLLGSMYYAEHPVFPLENTVANINIDMIGRIDEEHTSPDYTYVIGADRLSTDLHEINEAVNKKYAHLELDYTYNAKDDPNQFYYRSDHYNFARRGIPAIFYFSGVHEDYHQPTDTVDKIMFDKAANIARLAFHTAWELANREERIVVDVIEIDR